MKESLPSVILPSITTKLLVPESKLFSLGISRMLEICADSGSESKQFHWVSMDFDVSTCKVSGSHSDTESSEKVGSMKHRFSDDAVSLQFAVVSALVTWSVRQNSVV